jgi:DNA ligase D-like protein (predicted ligase)
MIKPMLCQATKPFDSEDWVYEQKLDGTRAIAYVDKKAVKFINRRERNITFRYPELAGLPKQVKAKSCVLDGEIILFDKKGRPDFHQLATREQTSNKTRIDILSKTMPATYVIFDILELNGKSLLSRPLLERKKLLKQTVKESDFVLLLDWVDTEGKKFFGAVKKEGLEGIIAKKKDSSYEAGMRSRKWLKIKATKTIDSIIIGFTEGAGRRADTFGALVLGLYDQKKLHHIGRVGTGWTEQELRELRQELEKHVTKNCPVKDTFDRWQAYEEKYKVHWMKPELVAEVEFLELTRGRELRAPSFKRLRFDKEPKECTFETVT